MSARHDYDPRSERQPVGRCPSCKATVQRGDLIHDGLLRTRSAARGGPYYLLTCSNCSTRIIVERSSPTASYVLRTERDLPPTSPLRRMLAEFLGGSARPRKREPVRRTFESRKPQSQRDGPDSSKARVWTDAQRRALEVLGLNDSATLAAVKHAYRIVARSLHPDAHPNDDEEQRAEWSRRFARAADAYRVLTAPSSKS